MSNSQKYFYAVELEEQDDNSDHSRELSLGRFGLEVAEEDGTLAAVASTYSPENNAVYDGVSRQGVRLVTFAPILKSDVMPLPKIVQLMMDVGRLGINSPVEIEFAVNYIRPEGQAREFAFLQIRPLVTSHETEALDVDDLNGGRVIVRSDQVLGNGQVENIRDIIMVDREKFDRSKSVLVAGEVGQFNAVLMAKKTPYLLIGMGRWGSSDPWLGIPVTWDQIAGARVIVESGFKDFIVTPSQGSHFFQNITSFQVGYFTVNADEGEGLIDWNWLDGRNTVESHEYTRHIRLRNPLVIRMNGHSHRGVIMRPR